MSSARIEVERFDGSGDFKLWKVRMLAHLGINGLKDILNDDKLLLDSDGAGDSSSRGGEAGTSESSQRSVSKDHVKVDKSERAMNIIIANVGDKVLRLICDYGTAAEMWSFLERTYVSKTLPNKIYLQLKFYNFKMDESKSIDANLDDYMKLVSSLNSIGIVVVEEVQAVLLLSSLPQKYDHLRETLTYARDSLTVEEIASAARDKERALKESGQLDNNVGEGLVLKERDDSHKKSFHKRDNSRGRSLYRYDPRRQGRSRSNSKSRVVCWYCRKEGHIRRDCYVRKKDEEKGNHGEAAVLTDTLHYSNVLTI